MADCTCAGQCPGAPNCTVLHILGPPTKCIRDCPEVGAIVKEAIFLKAEDRVDFDVCNKELAALAEIVQEVTEAEVLVPVGRLRDTVTTRVEGSSFEEAAEALGLGLRFPGQSGS